MARFLRFCVAFLCWPFIWALCRVAFDAFELVPARGETLLPPEGLAFLLGMVAFLVAWIVLPNPVRLYVLGHELTHAVWGLAFGARVSNLRVRATGGSVSLTKSNVWITLAPYFFPFYTLLVVVAAFVTRVVRRFCVAGADGAAAWHLPCPWAWTFAAGVTWCFHLCFTIRSLGQRQPDIEEYGRIFSWTFILAMNLAGVLVWILATTDLATVTLLRQILLRTTAAYGEVWRFADESLRALSVLSR